MIASLFHTLGHLLGERRKLTDRERYRARARQMRRELGLPPLKALGK